MASPMFAMLTKCGVSLEKQIFAEVLTVAASVGCDHGFAVISRSHSDFEIRRRWYGSESRDDLSENNRCLTYGQIGAFCANGVRDVVELGYDCGCGQYIQRHSLRLALMKLTCEKKVSE